VSVASRTLLAAFIAVVGLVGIAVAAARVAGDVSGGWWLAAVPAAAVGSALFFAFQTLARQPWFRDSVLGRARGLLFVAALVSVPFWADLPAPAELAVLAAGAGYLATTLLVIAGRLARIRAARRPA
jgi:hypothetical protein